jgi:hypothetical protein
VIINSIGSTILNAADLKSKLNCRAIFKEDFSVSNPVIKKATFIKFFIEIWIFDIFHIFERQYNVDESVHAQMLVAVCYIAFCYTPQSTGRTRSTAPIVLTHASED